MNYQINPYIAGDWVAAKNFYGREAQLVEILGQTTRVIHVVGMRRIGKTSLLKRLATTREALYIDLQRVGGDWGQFNRILQSVIRRERKQLPWLPNEEIVQKVKDVFELLETVDEHAYEVGIRLWLLLDETEQLINLGRKSADALQMFRSIIWHTRSMQIVFASAKQLSELDVLTSGVEYGSPFLNHFPPPIYLSGLDDEAAISLIWQSQKDIPMVVDNQIVQTICQRTNNHPFYIQWLCYHLWRKSDNAAMWNIDNLDFSITPDLQRILRHDFDYLSDPERQIIRAVLFERSLPNVHSAYVQGLINLGYLRQDETNYLICNEFFKNWLLDLETEAWTILSNVAAEPTLRLYKKEKIMSDPYTITGALMVMEKATEFLFNQAGEMLKEWREKRKKSSETLSTQTIEAANEPSINTSQELKTTLREQLTEFERQAKLAAYEMQVKQIESLMKQLENYRRNKLMFEEEATKLPSLDDRLAIRRRIEDIDTQIAEKADEMRQILEQLSKRKIHIPALDE